MIRTSTKLTEISGPSNLEESRHTIDENIARKIYSNDV
jgi:hypothetical protein